LLATGRLDRDLRREVVVFLARAHLARRDFGAAAALLQMNQATEGDDAELWALMGEAHLGLRAPAPALAAFTTAEKLAPPDAPTTLLEEINRRLAQLDEQLGRPEKALGRLDSMAPNGPDSAAERLALRALCLLQLGDTAGAKEAHTAAERESPNLLTVATAGIHVFLATHDYAAAISTAETALAAYPEAESLSFLRFQARWRPADGGKAGGRGLLVTHPMRLL
jgi:tetratricopeptide (TPR) repeat protein